MTPSTVSGAARVTISRTDERDVRQRQIYARIDDLPNHTLMFGDAFTVEIAPGSHRIKTNNTLFWKTVDFTIAPGEHLEFAVINTAGRLAFGFLALLGAAPLKLVVERKP